MSDAGALREQDAAARVLAQREFAAPLVLEAGAGTGKTATLVARILAWSLGPGWERSAAALADGSVVSDPRAERARVAARVLSRVVAITFTEAAAAEMATRVEEALRAVERGDPVRGLDPESLPAVETCHARAAALRDALDHLVVQTIHAYARRLLAAYPFEASLHPRLEVDADGTAAQAAVRRVLDGALREAYAEAGDALDAAADGAGPQELELALRALLEDGVAARDLAGDAAAPERVEALLGRVDAALDAFRDAEAGRLATVKRGISAETVEWLQALAAVRDRDADAPAALAALAERIAEGDKPLARVKEWAKGRLNKGEQAAVGDGAGAIALAAGELAPLLAHVAELDLEALARNARLLSGLLARVEQELARQGVATFGSLLSGAAGLLAARPDVAASIRRGVEQLLVDEFQDTDPQQCAIVAALALEGPRAERPGLFLVGDPKQSIYGWRSADLAAYEGFVSRALEQGGALHRLSVNQRSLPAVLDEVERVIRPVMQREPGVQPGFEPLLASEAHTGQRFEANERFAGVEHWIAARPAADGDAAEGEADAALVPISAGDATRLEARALARDLVELRRSGVPWGEVGVLFRSRGDWDVYLTALREAKVPFSVEGDRSYYRRREIIDASAWVRCVLDPSDTLALVAALRSAVVGVPDAAWLPLWSISLPERVARLSAPDPEALDALRDEIAGVAASLPEDVPGLARVAGWERNLVAAVEAIARLRQAFEEGAADDFVELLRETLLLEAVEAARFLGPWRVANLERFFRDLTTRLAEGADTQALLRELRHAVAEEEEMEEEPPHDGAADAVQILTLHGAKGLDFAHVYLMQLHKGTGERPGPRLDAARIDGRLELRLLGVPTLGFDRAQARRRRVAEAESVRLLYVGMTRAKRRLVLSGAWPEWLSRNPSGRLVDLCMQREGLPAPDRIQALARSGAPSFDADGVRFALPALREQAEAAPLPEPEAFVAEAGARPPLEMEARRRAARARMERPLGGRAALSKASADDAEARADHLAGAPGPQAPGAELARLAGSAVHLVLERLDLSRPVEESLRETDALLAAAVRGLCPPERAPRVAQEAARILEGLRGGDLARRLERIRHHVVARELPVLLPARDGDEALTHVAGAIDLVYREPADPARGAEDRWVVVDFKTDRVGSAAELAARAAEHARQGAVYARALREGLGLDDAPRVELWFLGADRCVEVGAETASSPSAPQQLAFGLDGPGA